MKYKCSVKNLIKDILRNIKNLTRLHELNNYKSECLIMKIESDHNYEHDAYTKLKNKSRIEKD